jgi:hypothetical protein
MIKKNNRQINRQINRVIYADESTPKPQTCKELQNAYCDKEFEVGVKEGEYKAAFATWQTEFGKFTLQVEVYNLSRKKWFNANLKNPKAKRYFKDHPDNKLGSIDDLIYLGDERRTKDQIRKKYPEPRTPANQKKLDDELTVINNELHAIFGTAPEGGLIKELRDLKNQSNLVDTKADEKDNKLKEKKKLDDELKKIKEDIEKKDPKCDLPKKC